MHAFRHWIGYVKFWRALVARDWGSPFVIKPGTVGILSSVGTTFLFRVSLSSLVMFIKFVPLDNHLTCVTLVACTFHQRRKSESCGGKCGISPLKSGTAKTHFQRRDDTLGKQLSIHIWSDTWYLYVSIRFVAYFRIIHIQCIFYILYSWFRAS